MENNYNKISQFGSSLIRMLWMIFTLMSASCFASIKADSTGEQILCTQEIRYKQSIASEIFLVWGINNWSQPDSFMLPPYSNIKDGLVYTPMQKTTDGFSVRISIPKGTIIDYVFWITKADEIELDIWDNNEQGDVKKDYHTYVLDNAISVIENDKLEIKPKEPVNVLGSSGYILGFAGLLFLGNIAYHRRKKIDLKNSLPSPFIIIVSTALSLWLLLLPARATILGFGWDFYTNQWTTFSKMLLSGYYDFWYVLITTLLFLLILWIFRNKKRAASIIAGTYIVVAVLSIIYSVLNVKIVEMIGRPFNYQWLYYSDFLGSTDSKSAISSNIEVDMILHILYLVLSLSLLSWLFATFINYLHITRFKKHIQFIIVPLVIMIYFVSAGTYTKKNEWDYAKLANPIAAFAESINPFKPAPSLFSLEVPSKLSEFEDKKHIKDAYISGKSSTKIKNVIIFVLESTPAEYIQPYSKTWQVTPELAARLNNAMVFNNIYAHAPATNKSMVSILNSIYPWLSFNSITQEHPDIEIPSIPSELKKHNYRTAFFNAGDNRFQGGEDYLKNREFSYVTDYRNLDCEKDVFKVEDRTWTNLDGANDECLVGAFNEWRKQDTSKPFFAMMWTFQTHYPYFITGNEKDYGTQDKTLNRYLNAVEHNDKVLGDLIRTLEKNNLYESTLIVVVGDHGEAFGRHDQTTHASHIYEENLHIPLILINPVLFKGETNNNIGGLVDIAPTLLDVTVNKIPGEWQGESLIGSRKKVREYFFAPWSNYLFGYREGNFKYIYDATDNVSEIYDLKSDPHEQLNLVEHLSSEQEKSLHYMAGWVQYQDKYLKKYMSRKKS